MRDLHLRLPASSANLGPGFDSLAIALKVYLNIDASETAAFGIEATGRDAAICGAAEGNLLVDTYRAVLAANGRDFVAIRLMIRNEIPLGMGTGSSAAARLAGVALASHFGRLEWSRERILSEAARMEGHPDNVAACWLGGFVASAWDGGEVRAVSIAPPREWRAVIVIPNRPLATRLARAVLPGSYSRQDTVANVQSVALLTAAFATGRADVIARAMQDRIHQPFRAEVCPLLPRLLPLAGRDGIAGVALSGAGPSVLLLTVSESAARQGMELATAELGSENEVEFLTCELENDASLAESG
jgi:homoserine kinase